MVVMILAIVTAIGVPSFNTMIKNNRLSAASNDVAGALHYARSEAVRRGSSVQVDALSSDISNGLQVWFDADGNSSLDAGEELRVVNLSDFSGVSISSSGGANVSLSYSPRGSVAGGGNLLTLNLCDDRSGNVGKQLNLLSSGVLRLKSNVAC